MNASNLERLGLTSNPFEPSATGAPYFGGLLPPTRLAEATKKLLDVHETGTGVKAIVIVGEYGTGKTCLLQWLHRQIFPERQIRSFYFDNPGVQFYDLANTLLRSIGRKDFAKFIWELAAAYVAQPIQRSLFQNGFEEYLSATYHRRQKPDMTAPLQDAIIQADVTADEEIAHCLARIVTDIVRKPYFEYRDFLPRQQNSVVPEGEEAPYFQAILKTILRGTNAKAIAFLIDEFEEIALQKRLTRRAAHDYLATLKRLINLAQSDQLDFWVVLSMTPDAYATTVELEPSLAERLSGRKLDIEPLTGPDAQELIRSRTSAARSTSLKDSAVTTFPFPEELLFRPTTYSNPRRLVKSCFRAVAEATDDLKLPFTADYLHSVEEQLYPNANATGSTTP